MVEGDPEVEEQLRGAEIHRSNPPVVGATPPLEVVLQLADRRFNLPPVPVLVGQPRRSGASTA